MKNGLPKFVQVVKTALDKNYVYRTQFPRYLIEIHDEPTEKSSEIVLDKTLRFATVQSDFDNNGEIPEVYLKEAIRWWNYTEADSRVTITPSELNYQFQSLPQLNSKSIYEFINGAYVAQDCFQKDRTWLYQRLNGNKVNGKKAEFNKEQKTQLAFYLRMQAQELTDYANRLDYSADLGEAYQIALERIELIPKNEETDDYTVNVELNGKKYSFRFILTRHHRKERIWVYAGKENL